MPTSTFKRVVRVGESVALSITGAARWSVYQRNAAGVATLIAAWRDGALADDPEPPDGLTGAETGPTFSEALIATYHGGAIPAYRGIVVHWYNDEGAATRTCYFQLGDGDQWEWLDKDRALLEILERARDEAADTQGIIEVSLPDGHVEKYANHAALRAVVEALRGQILRREQRLNSQYLQGWVAR